MRTSCLHITYLCEHDYPSGFRSCTHNTPAVNVDIRRQAIVPCNETQCPDGSNEEQQ